MGGSKGIDTERSEGGQKIEEGTLKKFSFLSPGVLFYWYVYPVG